MSIGFDGRPKPAEEDVSLLVTRKLQSSGLTAADGEALGITPLTAEAASREGFWGGRGYIAMRIPYLDPFGSDWGFARARCLLDPLPVILSRHDGSRLRFPKYSQPKHSPVHAYFPPLIDWRAVAKDFNQPIIFTEGELKAACATKRGFATIGLGGIWSFMSKKHQINFLPELQRFEWVGRNVYICYDTDPEAKPQSRKDVDTALYVLASRLIQLGAFVHRATLPSSGAAKVGLDDYLIAAGDEAFREVLRTADEIKDWKVHYQLGTSGPINNVENVVIALRNAPELIDCFGLNLMTRSTWVLSPLPHEEAETFKPRSFDDLDVTHLRVWLQREGGLTRIGAADVLDAVRKRASERPYHPVRDMLNDLRWDGVERLSGWLRAYLGAADGRDPRYLPAIGRMFLIGMVARVMEPGCQVDYALVIEGEQGTRKSTLCRVLAGDEWFSDSLPDINGKDDKRLFQHLRGKWLIEIAELSSMRKSESEDVKKFITRRVEQYTPMYGRTGEVTEPRQCVFVGTTNDQEYLNDETGGRRWWPVAAGRIDVEAFTRDRDQLLAEAVAAYHAGEKHHPDAVFEVEVIYPEQVARTPDDPWVGIIRDAYDTWDGKLAEPFAKTSAEIAMIFLEIEKRAVTKQVTNRVNACLKRLGWTLLPKSHGSRRWAPPVAATPAETDKVVKIKRAKF